MLCLRVAHSSFHYTVELALTLARWKRKKGDEKTFFGFRGNPQLVDYMILFFSGVSACFVEMKRSSENVGKISLEKCGKKLSTHRWYRDFLFCGFLIKFGWCGNWRLIIASDWKEKSQLRLEKNGAHFVFRLLSPFGSAELVVVSIKKIENSKVACCTWFSILPRFHSFSATYTFLHRFYWRSERAVPPPCAPSGWNQQRQQMLKFQTSEIYFFSMFSALYFFCSVEDLCLRLIATKNN